MLKFEGEPTDIVEIPVIVVDGSVKLIAPQMQKLNEASLKDIATAMNGSFIYLKVRATFTQLESQLCAHRGCWRKADTDSLTCEDH